MAELQTHRTEVITTLSCGKFSATVCFTWRGTNDVVRMTQLQALRNGTVELNAAEIDDLVALLQAAQAVQLSHPGWK